MARQKNEKPQPTVDEIISLLKKTNLPTVICEGSDDIIVYRRLEELLAHIGVSVLPVGGRKNVLKIFDRLTEIPVSVKIAFIADRDTWVNTYVPQYYSTPILCLTRGYSIENDLYIDGNLENMLYGNNLTDFKDKLASFIDWYALALERHLNDQSNPISHHPEYVLNPQHKASLMALDDGEVYPTGTKNNLLKDYKTLVRGKSLFSLLILCANAGQGSPKHTDKGLMNAVSARPGHLLLNLTSNVEAALNIVRS